MLLHSPIDMSILRLCSLKDKAAGFDLSRKESMNLRTLAGLTVTGVCVLWLGCGGGKPAADADRAAESPAATEQPADTQPSTTEGLSKVEGDTVTTESGLQYIMIKAGAGESPSVGERVSVHYTGWFLDGRKFDSSHDRGQPYEFPLGMKRVIAGWDEGVALMKPGEKRRLIIPSTLAYGERGYPGVIPPNATLVFDLEYLSSKPGGQ